MAVYYTVRADVIDIAHDKPLASDRIFVDTNVWFWLTYSRASLGKTPPRGYQLTRYNAYTNAVLVAGGTLLHSGLNLAELVHLIEKTEHEIYEKLHVPLLLKEYRHNYPSEHQTVRAELTAVWMSVQGLSNSLDCSIDDTTTAAAFASFGNVKVDGYDLFMLETMRRNGVTNIITDDGDFVTVPGICVFTSNRGVIAAAQAQGKLITR